MRCLMSRQKDQAAGSARSSAATWRRLPPEPAELERCQPGNVAGSVRYCVDNDETVTMFTALLRFALLFFPLCLP